MSIHRLAADKFELKNAAGEVQFTIDSEGNVVAQGTASASALSPSGLSGSGAAARLVGGTASGAPTTGTFEIGDVSVDQSGNLYVCTAAGTPGTWKSVATLPAATSAPATNPPVSGTVYQNTGAQDVEFSIPVTYSPTTTAAATLAVARGSASSPATIFTLSKPAGLTAADGEVEVLNLRVPAGWYWSLTATNATIGTAAGITV